MGGVALGDLWWRWWLDLAWQVPSMTIVVLLLDRMLGRVLGSRAVLALWAVIFAKAILPPLWTSSWALPTLSPPTVDAATVPLAATRSFGFAHPLLALWSVGFALIAVRWVHGHRRAWRAIRDRSRPVDASLGDYARELASRLGYRGRLELRVDPAASSPALIGCLRTIIVLPPQWIEAPPNLRLEHALLHEIAHLKRRDPWWRAAWTFVQLVHWYQPTWIIIRRRVALWQEVGCDAAVVRALGGDASRYRRTLLETAVAGLAAPRRLALGFFGSTILTRVAHLEHRDEVRRGWSRASLVGLAVVPLLGAVVLPDSDRASSTAARVARPDDARDEPSDDPGLVQLAQRTVDEHRRGERTGCMTLRYASLYLAQQESVETDPSTRP
ncbi:MAG: M56 family metallopeptidase [Planctomycetes bacterium]|nr:M56 family metallopeptidase [Planctomycetota bacterium]